MQRPDTHVLKSVQKTYLKAKKYHADGLLTEDGWKYYFKCMSPEDLNHTASLPLVALSKDDLRNLNELRQEKNINHIMDVDWNEWIYDQFILYYPALDDGGYFWAEVTVDKEQDIAFLFGLLPTEGRAKWGAYDIIDTLPLHGWVKRDGDSIDLHTDPNYVQNVYGKAINAEDINAEEVKEQLTGILNNYLITLHLLHCYLKEGDKHPVEVSPKVPANPNSPKNKGKPWRIKGPSLLLLDRMPSQTAPGTGTHASPTPHRRRGHWRTLTNARYKNHPQYGGKIYVKPSFIGPRQEVYQGNVYRLMQEAEEWQEAG